jgi:hypothetical protein
MAILSSIIRQLNTKRINKIEHFKKYPVETQQENLFRIISAAASTEWGRKYDYSSIRSVKEYQSRVPVRSYEEYLPYIERLRKGETRPPKMFLQSIPGIILIPGFFQEKHLPLVAAIK